MTKRRQILALATLVVSQGFMVSSRLQASTGRLNAAGLAAEFKKGDITAWCYDNCRGCGPGMDFCCDGVTHGLNVYCYWVG